MGVEMGVPDFNVDGGPSSLLPLWFNRDGACAPDMDIDAARKDEDECGGGVLLDGPDGPDMSDSSSQHDVGCGSEPVFLENAMTIAGLRHITSNLKT